MSIKFIIVQHFRGYMRRFKKAGRRHGDVVYLITASWFNKWKVHTSYEVQTDKHTHTHSYLYIGAGKYCKSHIRYTGWSSFGKQWTKSHSQEEQKKEEEGQKSSSGSL